MDGWAQQGHGAAQLYDASGVTALPNHLIDARGAQPRMLAEGLAHELHVRVRDTGAQRLSAVEAVRLDGIANGIGMNAEFSCNGADFPVLGVKITANLYVSFRADHLFSLPKRGLRGKGSTKRLLRPQTMQRRNGARPFSGQRWTITGLRSGAGFVDSEVPQSNTAGEGTDWEP